ncbi:hypothetical protein [Microbacterium thalli]|uniref:Uncharacterized protein n=1 Tax=Microbacterium thalli TaxID=3027921 RepID=A0ABT5SF87_9MICO|nr:hypothetical protein [Microbacterium thalli]MDD7960782.1 hypothetical protein [Microbacterium thalli]
MTATTSTAGSFWLLPSLLIAVVIVVGLIARQRERVRRGMRPVTRLFGALHRAGE